MPGVKTQIGYLRVTGQIYSSDNSTQHITLQPFNMSGRQHPSENWSFQSYGRVNAEFQPQDPCLLEIKCPMSRKAPVSEIIAQAPPLSPPSLCHLAMKTLNCQYSTKTEATMELSPYMQRQLVIATLHSTM